MMNKKKLVSVVISVLLLLAVFGIMKWMDSKEGNNTEKDSGLNIVTASPDEKKAPDDGKQESTPQPTDEATPDVTPTEEPTGAADTPTPTRKSEPTEKPTKAPTKTPTKTPTPTKAPTPTKEPAIAKDGWYYSKDEVALYIHTYGCLPSNYITKNEAEDLGWSGGSVQKYKKGAAIGGSVFGNYEGLLPKKKGRTYYECDIDTDGKSSRGAKRIIYSNDGLIYYTDDHYESFTQLY